ncbi:hypothetical protein J6590_043693 [Homalodisca vitripennis]|nr:hypothetical protein J6590_043693 [Homalodisca vitripennis]
MDTECLMKRETLLTFSIGLELGSTFGIKFYIQGLPNCVIRSGMIIVIISETYQFVPGSRSIEQPISMKYVSDVETMQSPNVLNAFVTDFVYLFNRTRTPDSRSVDPSSLNESLVTKYESLTTEAAITITVTVKERALIYKSLLDINMPDVASKTSNRVPPGSNHLSLFVSLHCHNARSRQRYAAWLAFCNEGATVAEH